MKQKTYSCVLRFKGGVIHTVPLEAVTKSELQLLAFLHGVDAVVEIKYVGDREFYFPAGDEGMEPTLVKSEREELRRLARKYDNVVNSGRGRKAVETCFHTTLDDFDSVVAEVDALAAIDSAAQAAEAKAAQAVVAAGGAEREKIEKERAEAEAALAKQPVGSRVFGEGARA
jgi:hypothetical protein